MESATQLYWIANPPCWMGWRWDLGTLGQEDKHLLNLRCWGHCWGVGVCVCQKSYQHLDLAAWHLSDCNLRALISPFSGPCTQQIEPPPAKPRASNPAIQPPCKFNTTPQSMEWHNQQHASIRAQYGSAKTGSCYSSNISIEVFSYCRADPPANSQPCLHQFTMLE